MSKRKVLLGLIGTNIMESLSPALFADAFVAAGIDGFYHLMDVNLLLERRLAKLLDATKAIGFAGTNITYPFKQEVIALLDAVDPEAAQIGAVNTVALILRAIMARSAAESRANLSGISRLRREWSTRHRWACAAFPAIRYQFLRSERRFGRPTSFIRRSKRSSSKPLPPRGPAC
jgi:hypothetical protein